MKLFLSFLLITVTCFRLESQNLIGYKGTEIKSYMIDNRKDMNPENVVNSKFIYLKYSDESDSETILFFLDQDSVCQGIRFICDRLVRNEKIREFNSTCRIIGENKWIDTLSGRRIIIDLKDDDWSSDFTIGFDKYHADGSN
jgi:hypothetical protein